MANLSTVELVSLPETFGEYAEHGQKQGPIRNTDHRPPAFWDPVLKRNRAKRLQLFARLLEIGLLRPRLKGAAKHFLGIFFVNKRRKRQKRLVNWSFVSPGVNLCSLEAMDRIEVCLPEHMEEESPAWHSALERVSSSALGWVTSKSVSGVDTVLASGLSLSGSHLEGSLLEDHSEVDLSWCCLSVGFSWTPYFVQTTNESIMTRSLEPTGSRIMNDRALPATFAAGNRQKGATGSNHFVFVDNSGVFGVCRA